MTRGKEKFFLTDAEDHQLFIPHQKYINGFAVVYFFHEICWSKTNLLCFGFPLDKYLVLPQINLVL